MRSRYFIAVLLWVALAAGAGAAPQATGMGTVGGKVLASNGKPVEGARVTLQGSDGKHPETTQTNSHGQFWFPMLPSGLYDVRAYSNGRISEWRHNVWVEVGKQSSVTLHLGPKKSTSKKPSKSKSGGSSH